MGPTVTIQQNPNEGLEVLGHHLPQGKGFSGCLGEQAHKEDNGVLWWQSCWVDITGETGSEQILED